LGVIMYAADATSSAVSSMVDTVSGSLFSVLADHDSSTKVPGVFPIYGE
jgi:hypothetical protein